MGQKCFIASKQWTGLRTTFDDFTIMDEPKTNYTHIFAYVIPVHEQLVLGTNTSQDRTFLILETIRFSELLILREHLKEDTS